MDNILDALIECKKLSVLNLEGNTLSKSKESIASFPKAFAQLDSLTQINLKDNFIANKEDLLDKFAEILNTRQNLRQLNLANNRMGFVKFGSIKKFAKAIEANTAITHFDLSGNKTNLQNMSHLTSIIKKNDTIQVLLLN